MVWVNDKKMERIEMNRRREWEEGCWQGWKDGDMEA